MISNVIISPGTLNLQVPENSKASRSIVPVNKLQQTCQFYQVVTCHVKIGLVTTYHLQTCYLLKQLAASLWITTCNKSVDILQQICRQQAVAIASRYIGLLITSLLQEVYTLQVV